MNADAAFSLPPKYKHPRLRRFVIVFAVLFAICASLAFILYLLLIAALVNADTLAFGPGASEICHTVDSVQINGRILDQSSSEPISHANVRVQIGNSIGCEFMSPQAAHQLSIFTGQDGTFTTTAFFNAPPREITAVVEADGCTPKPLTIPIAYDEGAGFFYTSRRIANTPMPDQSSQISNLNLSLHYRVEMTIPLTCSA